MTRRFEKKNNYHNNNIYNPARPALMSASRIRMSASEATSNAELRPQAT